jgi:NAD-dependent deacetylase
MKTEINPQKIVILSGAGISAESGISTFRDANGLWQTHSIEKLASLTGWVKNPDLVNEFYNIRRENAWNATPNAAHLALAQLEQKYEVVIITQNVDILHERAGSSQVLHLHGNIHFAQSVMNSALKYRIDGHPLDSSQKCELGHPLRPDIVWFGEPIRHAPEAISHIQTASKVLVVGTSLLVQPAASFVKYAHPNAEKVLINLEPPKIPKDFDFWQGTATERVVELVDKWMKP